MQVPVHSTVPMLEKVKRWQEVTGASREEAVFFIKCGGGNLERAVNIFFEDPGRFIKNPTYHRSKLHTETVNCTTKSGLQPMPARIPSLVREVCAKETDAKLVSKSYSGESSTDIDQLKARLASNAYRDSIEYPTQVSSKDLKIPVILSENIEFLNVCTHSPVTTPGKPGRGCMLSDQQLLEHALLFFKQNKVLAMCQFLVGKTLRTKNFKSVRSYISARTGVAVSARRVVKIISDNRDQFIANTKEDVFLSKVIADQTVTTAIQGHTTQIDGKEKDSPITLRNERNSRSGHTCNSATSENSQSLKDTAGNITKSVELDLEEIGAKSADKKEIEISNQSLAMQGTSTATVDDNILQLDSLPVSPFPLKLNRSLSQISSSDAELKSDDKWQSAEYWDGLRVLLSPRLSTVTNLTPEDLRIVLVFLEIGNLSATDGSVRQYSDLELMSPRVGKSLAPCRSHITNYVKAVINLLLDHSHLLKRCFVSPKSDTDETTVYNLTKKCVQESNEENDFLPQSQNNVHCEELAEEYLLLRSLKALIGNRTWNLHGQNNHIFKYINSQALRKLNMIANNGETNLFPKFRGAFAAGIKVPEHRHHRLDDSGVLPVKSTLQKQLDTSFGALNPHESEFLVIVEYLARLIDPFFQCATRELAEVSCGQWKAAPPKTCVRMAAKLTKDHLYAAKPKAAANLDTARCALTFTNPSELRAGFQLCDGGCSGVLKLLRTKNNFLETYDARKQSFGYRSILANYLLSLPQTTWGDLFVADLHNDMSIRDNDAFLPQFFHIGQEVIVQSLAGASARRNMTGIIAAFGDNGLVKISYENESPGRRHHGRRIGPPQLRIEDLITLNKETCQACLNGWKVPDSLKHVPDIERLVTRLQSSLFCNGALRRTPVHFIVEIQFLLTDYLRMRRRSHVWYKINRTLTMDDTVSDFYAYAGIRRNTSFLLEAFKMNDDRTIQYFMKWCTHRFVHLTAHPTSISNASSIQLDRCTEKKSQGTVAEDERNTQRTLSTDTASRSGGQPLNHPSKDFEAQIFGCYDDDTGFSVLHFIAEREDGRYNELLASLLKIKGIDINEVSSAGTAHAIAVRSGNDQACELLMAHPCYNVAWESLPALFDCTNGWEWHNQTGWCTSKTLNNWWGITTHLDSGRVIGVNLPFNNLKGSLTSITTYLHPMKQSLKYISLKHNNLSGSIPSEMGTLVGLEHLDLGENKLTGHIPSELRNLVMIRHLGLGENDLRGLVPTSTFVKMPCLRRLELNGNRNLISVSKARSWFKKSMPQCEVIL